MFEQFRIAELVSYFENRGVYLYHACQLVDFASYIVIGGIPSRACLEQAGMSFTWFVTDGTDHHTGVWNKVFLNLSDFGRTFAKGGRGVPNPYGPILLMIRPYALTEATDVAICLRSAGGRHFNRRRESLATLEDVDSLFRYKACAGPPRSAIVKYKPELRQIYPFAEEPELSCSVTCGYLPFKYVERIIVDPYVIDQSTLEERVLSILKFNYANVPVVRRSDVTRDRLVLYGALASAINGGARSIRQLADITDQNPDAREWASALLKQDLDWQFGRFARYLFEGTLRPTCSEFTPPDRSRRVPASRADSGAVASGEDPAFQSTYTECRLGCANCMTLFTIIEDLDPVYEPYAPVYLSDPTRCPSCYASAEYIVSERYLQTLTMDECYDVEYDDDDLNTSGRYAEIDEAADTGVDVEGGYVSGWYWSYGHGGR